MVLLLLALVWLQGDTSAGSLPEGVGDALGDMSPCQQQQQLLLQQQQ
jgi:hypothetical protein